MRYFHVESMHHSHTSSAVFVFFSVLIAILHQTNLSRLQINGMAPDTYWYFLISKNFHCIPIAMDFDSQSHIAVRIPNQLQWQLNNVDRLSFLVSRLLSLPRTERMPWNSFHTLLELVTVQSWSLLSSKDSGEPNICHKLNFEFEMLRLQMPRLKKRMVNFKICETFTVQMCV